MPMFDTYLMVDWSAADPSKTTSKKPKKDAIWWAARWRKGLQHSVVAYLQRIRDNAPEGSVRPSDSAQQVRGGQVYEETRPSAIDHIYKFLKDEVEAKRRVLVGFDFAFGYPSGFAKHIVGQPASAAQLWRHFHDHLVDSVANGDGDRWIFANELNDIVKKNLDDGPFWDVHGRVHKGNPYTKKNKTKWPFDFKPKRVTDSMAPDAKTVWQLSGPGSVGSQALLGVPWLLDLRERLRCDIADDRCVVWPFDTGFSAPTMDEGPQVVIVEIYPSLLRDAVDRHKTEEEVKADIVDCAQVRLNALAFSLLDNENQLGQLFLGPSTIGTKLGNEQPRIPEIKCEEGWIFGVDQKLYSKHLLSCALMEYLRSREKP